MGSSLSNQDKNFSQRHGEDIESICECDIASNYSTETIGNDNLKDTPVKNTPEVKNRLLELLGPDENKTKNSKGINEKAEEKSSSNKKTEKPKKSNQKPAQSLDSKTAQTEKKPAKSMSKSTESLNSKTIQTKEDPAKSVKKKAVEKTTREVEPKNTVVIAKRMKNENVPSDKKKVKIIPDRHGKLKACLDNLHYYLIKPQFLTRPNESYEEADINKYFTYVYRNDKHYYLAPSRFIRKSMKNPT